MSSFNEYYQKNIAKQLRRYRLKYNLTQEKLSEILGKNIKYIGHIERCERQISNKTLMEIFEILRIQPKDFYNFDNYYSWK